MSDDDVSPGDLISLLDDTNEHGEVKKLAVNLAQPLQETSQIDQKRANLRAADEIVTENLDKWAPIVNSVNQRRTITFENKSSNINLDNVPLTKTALGSEIDAILKEGKNTREDQITLENDTLMKLSEEDYRQKVEQLARLRNLQFYNEQKARRWKKIKSKQFRRIHKKDMGDLSLEELAEVDPEAFKRKLEKIESDRAKERATLRHKNTSQWVRRVLSRGLKAASDDVQKSYEQQVKLGEELSKKVNGYGLGNSEDESEDDSKPLRIPDPVKNDSQLKALFDMQFMKEAEGKKEKELEEYTKMVEGDENAEEIPSTGIVTIRSDKSLKLKQKTEPTKEVEKTENKKEEKESIIEKTEKVETENVETEIAESNEQQEESQPTNPWLVNNKKKRSSRFVSATSFNQITEADLKAAGEKINFSKKDDQKENIEDLLGLEEEFNKDKEEQAIKEAERELPSMDELHLEGWGSWAGPGAEESAGARRRRERIEAEREKIKQEALRERKDSQLPHVIYSDIADPAVEKYSITTIPKNYSNSKQLQAQYKYPIGPESNSSSGFQKLIKPDMITQSGQVIEPIFFTKNRIRKEKLKARKPERKPLEDSKKKKSVI